MPSQKPMLIIVESPSKCPKIAEYLGTEYVVKASVGHVRVLDGVDVKHDFTPTYVIPPRSQPIVKQLCELAHASREVILATDNDREGEAIAWHLCQVLSLPVPTTKRIVFNEITEGALHEAVQHPRMVDMHLVHAQQARAILDRLIGFSISPILWTHITRGSKDKALSAGRCQTPALRLVYENEQALAEVKTSLSNSISIHVTSTTSTPIRFQAEHMVCGEEHVSALLTLLCRHRKPQVTVTSVKVSNGTHKPPPPYTTSTLQQDAANIGISPAVCMAKCQKLYEAGYITYMRTDSTILCADFQTKARKHLEALYAPTFGGRFAPTFLSSRIRGGKDEVVAQSIAVKKAEAHEAIRPTHLEVRTLAAISPAEYKRYGFDNKSERLYHMIWTRTLGAFMTPQQTQTVSVTAKCTDSKVDDVLGALSVSSQKEVFAGFKILHEHNIPADESFGVLSSIKQGDTLPITQCVIEETLTSSSRVGRYNEGALVKKLEKLGIGRPSTFHSLVQKIKDREYVARKSTDGTPYTFQQLTVTYPARSVTKTGLQRTINRERDKLFMSSLGNMVLPFLLKHFSTVFDYGYTAAVETQLDMIAKGTAHWVDVVRQRHQEFSPIVRAVSKELRESTARERDKHTRVLDPSISVIIGRYGAVICQKLADAPPPSSASKKTPSKLKTTRQAKGACKFAPLPPGVSMEEVTLEQARHQLEFPKTLGTHDGQPVVLALGRYSPYLKHAGHNYRIPSAHHATPWNVTLEAAVGFIRDAATAQGKQKNDLNNSKYKAKRKWRKKKANP